VAYDCRGHGESEGGLDGSAWQDVGTALYHLLTRPEVDAVRIALVGSSGRSTGPHLHFEVIRHGVRVEPRQYLSHVLGRGQRQ
jgi:hypothetical protein